MAAAAAASALVAAVAVALILPVETPAAELGRPADAWQAD